MRDRSGLLFISLSLLFQCAALVFGKFASLNTTSFTPRGILTNEWYLATLLCLGLQAVSWPLALRRLPLFQSYVFMSAVYIVIPIASHFIFHEKVSVANMAGATLIAVGIIVMMREQREVPHG